MKRANTTVKISETQLVKLCLEYLEYKGYFFWRNNSGALKTERGGFVRFGSVGSPDIFIVKNGICIGVECKVGKNKLSEAQFTFGENLVKAGGTYIVVRSLDDMIMELEN